MDISFKTSVSIAILILATHLPAKAIDVSYVPAFCPSERLRVHFKNTTPRDQRVWTQVRIEGELIEKHYDLQPREETKIAGTDFLIENRGFSLKSFEPQSVQYRLSCDNQAAATPTSTTSPQVEHKFPLGTRMATVHLLNLFLNSNTVQLRAYSAGNTLVDSRKITLENYYDTESFRWNFSTSIHRIEILGQQRLHSFAFFKDIQGREKQSPSLPLGIPALNADPDKVYFLVSTKETSAQESFVIALDDPQMIQTARDQLHNPAFEKIIVAGIELGHGNYNRSFSAKDRAPYSWSVHRVDAFADFAHIDCDGSPDLTEERLYQKLNEGGRICFWRYRVTRELTYQEVVRGQLKP